MRDLMDAPVRGEPLGGIALLWEAALAHSETLWRAGVQEESVRVLEAAREVLEGRMDGEMRAGLETVLAAAWIEAGDLEEAERTLSRARRLAEACPAESPVRSLASLAATEGKLRLLQCRYGEAAAAYLRAAERADPGLRLTCLNDAAVCQVALGDPARAEALFTRCAAGYAALGEPEALARTWTNLAMLYEDMGQPDRARQAREAAARAATPALDPPGQMVH